MEALDTAERLSTEAVQLQFAAMDNLCAAFNVTVDGATLRFYPYGGALYRYFMPESASKYTETNDLDGFLVVIPDDVTLQDCLTDNEEAYANVTDKIVNVYKRLANTVFSTDEQRALWLEAASTDAFTLTSNFESSSWEASVDDEMSKKIVLGQAGDEYFNMRFDATIVLHKAALDKRIDLDIHFGVLQRPVYGNMYAKFQLTDESSSGKVCEMVATASQHHQFPNVFVCSVETFFIDQCLTMLKSMKNFYNKVILHPDVGTDAHDKVMYLSRQDQSVLKAEKRLMRVSELVASFPNIEETTLKEFYTVHERDAFQPFIASLRKDEIMSKMLNNGLLQPYALRKNVDLFNKVFMFGYEGNRKKTQPRVEGKTRALVEALRKPVREIMDLVQMRETNALTSVFVLSEDVTAGEMMHLLLFTYERLVDQIRVSAQKAAAFGKVYRENQAKKRAEAKRRKEQAKRERAARKAAAEAEKKRAESHGLYDATTPYTQLYKCKLRF